MLKTQSFHPAGHQDNDGFSLIFVSILLTVAALVFVSFLPGQGSNDPNQKNIANIKKLERVEEAMRSFMAANGRRPCPADGQYAENTANFGVEAGTPGTCTGNTAPTPNAPLGPDAGTGFVVGGTIPTKTIGLPDDYAYDDYGRRFTYVVDLRATASAQTAIGKSTTNFCGYLENNIKSPDFYNNLATPAITIENTTTAGNSTVIDHTMYAYISHGASGYGAWPANGTLQTTSANMRINSGSTDADMQVNAGVNPDFSGHFTNVKVKKDRVAPNITLGNTGFDDTVWYSQYTKDTCCLGTACLQKGFVAQGNGGDAGWSIATGDVNGDGIADLVIGAPWINSGVVYVVFGTRTGFPDPLPLANLNGTNGFVLNATETPYTGWSIATGDVNGDGIADIIIGATASSKAFVVFGHSGNWAPSYPLTLAANGGTLIDGTHGVRFDSSMNNDWFGMSVAAADVNGDGYADIIIGAHAEYGGYAYVIFGNNTVWNAVAVPNGGSVVANTGSGTLIDGIQGIRFDGAMWSDQAGQYTGTGDINGDGIADLIIAAPTAPAGNGPGYTYVVFGKNAGTTNPFLSSPGTTLTTSNNSNALTITGSYSDLIVGETLSGTYIPTGTTINSCNGITPPAPFGTACTSGPVTLSATATGNSPVTIATAPLAVGSGTFIDGTQGVRFDNSGVQNLATGDINGDGIPDLIIGAPNCNCTYVVFGKAGIWPGDGVDNPPSHAPNGTYNLGLGVSLIDGTQGVRFHGATGSAVGFSVATGNVNGNGYADLIMGAPWANYSYSTGGTTAFNTVGYTYVVFGKSGSWGTPDNSLALSTDAPPGIIDGTQGFRLDGPAGSGSGMSVATGDINGDGIPDLIIGAGSAPNNTLNGYVYVYFGHKSSINNTNPWPQPNFSLGNL